MGKRAIGKLTHYLGVAFTFLVLILTVLSPRASHFHPENSFLLPFLGLAYPVLLILNILLMLWWIIRFRFWFIVPVIAIASGFSYIRALYYPPFLSKGEEQGNFRIASYNVSAFNYPITDLDAKDLAAFMKDEKVDILCMQEFAGSNVVNDSMLLSAFTYWPYKFIPDVDNKDFNRPVIFSRYPLSHKKLIAFKNTKNCAIFCDAKIHGKYYRIFNNHLQTTEMTQIKEKKGSPSIEREEYYLRKRMNALYHNFCIRAQQADEIHALVQQSPYPVILCGDFNDTPVSYTYKAMLGDLKDGFVTNGTGNASSYRYAKRMFRIDYIFYSEQLKATRYFKADFGESDHYPVLMELKL